MFTKEMFTAMGQQQDRDNAIHAVSYSIETQTPKYEHLQFNTIAFVNVSACSASFIPFTRISRETSWVQWGRFLYGERLYPRPPLPPPPLNPPITYEERAELQDILIDGADPHIIPLCSRYIKSVQCLYSCGSQAMSLLPLLCYHHVAIATAVTFSSSYTKFIGFEETHRH